MICTLPNVILPPSIASTLVQSVLLKCRTGQGQAMIALVPVPILWLGETVQGQQGQRVVAQGDQW